MTQFVNPDCDLVWELRGILQCYQIYLLPNGRIGLQYPNGCPIGQVDTVEEIPEAYDRYHLAHLEWQDLVQKEREARGPLKPSRIPLSIPGLEITI